MAIKQQQITFYITEDIKKEVTEKAKQLGVSVSTYCLLKVTNKI